LIYGSGKAANEDITFAIQPQNVFKISNKNPHMKSCENNPLGKHMPCSLVSFCVY